MKLIYCYAFLLKDKKEESNFKMARDLHFLDEELKVQRGQGIYSQPVSCFVA